MSKHFANCSGIINDLPIKMSSLDRLLKAFESVRGSNQGTDKKSDKTGVQQVNPTTSLSFEDSGRPPLDSQKTMSSLASTLSQQSQNLLSSKRDQPLTSREKLSLCQSVSESLITGGKSGTDAQKLIGIGMETLLVLIDDQDPDVRMSADEALNRVIRTIINMSKECNRLLKVKRSYISENIMCHCCTSPSLSLFSKERMLKDSSIQLYIRYKNFCVTKIITLIKCK
ncbi:Huntingtin [Armadillidium vulgare]|nr:Huntingtin [Armadillidium vulgare]